MAEGVPFFIGSRSLDGAPVARRDSDLMARFRAAGLVTLGLTTVPEMAISFATESIKHGPTRNPWEPAAGRRGIQRWLCRSGGGRGGATRARQRRSRLDPDPRFLLWPSRSQAEPGSHPVRARHGGSIVRAPPASSGSPGPSATPPTCSTRSKGPAPATSTPRRLHAVATPTSWGSILAHCGWRSRRRAWSGAAVDPEVAAAAVRAGAHARRHGSLRRRGEPGRRLGRRHAQQRRRDGGHRRALPHGAATARSAQAGGRLPADPRRGGEAQRAGSGGRVRCPEPGDPIGRRILRRLRPAGHADARATARAARHAAAGRPRPHARSWLQSLFDYGPFTVLFNISGQPAISLPLAQSQSGLPIGVQLVAAYGREDLLLQIAAQLEQAMPWKHRTPQSHIGQALPDRTGRR